MSAPRARDRGRSCSWFRLANEDIAIQCVERVPRTAAADAERRIARPAHDERAPPRRRLCRRRGDVLYFEIGKDVAVHGREREVRCQGIGESDIELAVD